MPHLAGVMDPELWFSKRWLKFIKINSDYIIVRTIINVDLNGTHSIMGGNWRYFRSKYEMEECNIMKSWGEKCKNECESVRVCEQKCPAGKIGVTWLCLIRRKVTKFFNFYVQVKCF